MPQEVEQQARKELARLERMPEASGEYSMIRAYLDWLIALPWSVSSPESIYIAHARQVLDEDHFGLERINLVGRVPELVRDALRIGFDVLQLFGSEIAFDL